MKILESFFKIYFTGIFLLFAWALFMEANYWGPEAEQQAAQRLEAMRIDCEVNNNGVLLDHTYKAVKVIEHHRICVSKNFVIKVEK
jgi:hypothetical protein